MEAMDATRTPSARPVSKPTERVAAGRSAHCLISLLPLFLQRTWLTPPSEKGGFTRNRTHVTTKSNHFPLPVTHTKPTVNDVRDLSCAEKKREKSDPRVRFLVK